MSDWMPSLIFAAGCGQLSILAASALVPLRLNWREAFKPLSTLHRQMYWVYGGYVVLAIVAFGVISITNSQELASGSGLARAFFGYVAMFWGIRLSLQAVLDVRPHLTAWWLAAGYHTLTVLFTLFTAIYGYAAVVGVD